MLDLPVFESTDKAVVVMGLTGAGKSTFINLLVGQEVSIGHGLSSWTARARLFPCIWRDGHRIWLLDTPGFDDTTRSDASTLREITSALIALKKNVELIGIVYLHPITDIRMHGAAQKSLKILKGLCGEAAYKFIMLVTTMWEDDRGSGRIFEDREFDLHNNSSWWGKMIEKGSMHKRHWDSRDSAEDIITEMLTKYSLNKPFTPQIYTEMEVEHKALEDTVAGIEENQQLHELRQRLDKTMRDMRNDHNRAIRERQDQHVAELEQQKARLTEQILQAEQAREQLRVKSDEAMRETRAEYDRDLEQLRKQRDEANQAMEDLEKQLRCASEEREKDRRRFEQDEANYKERIAALEEENQRLQAERDKAEVAQKAQPPPYNAVVAQKDKDLVNQVAKLNRRMTQQQQELRYQRDLLKRRNAEYNAGICAASWREQELKIYHQQAAQAYNKLRVIFNIHFNVMNILIN